MKVPLVVLFLAIIVLVAVATSATIFTMLLDSSEKAQEEQREVIRVDLVDRQRLAILDEFEQPIAALRMLVSASLRGAVDHRSEVTFVEHLLDARERYSDVSYLAAMKTGAAVFTNPMQPTFINGSRPYLAGFVRPSDRNLNCRFPNGTSGQENMKRAFYRGFNNGSYEVTTAYQDWDRSTCFYPPGRPWFTGALNAQGTQMYFSELLVIDPGVENYQGTVAFTIAAKMYDTDANVVGAYGVDVASRNVTNFLQSKPMMKTGKAILLDARDGHVVGPSWNETVWFNDNGTTVVKHVSQMTREPLLISTYRATGINWIFQCKSPCRVTVKDDDGEEIFVDVVDVTNADGLPLRYLQMIPRSDFDGEIRERTKIAIIISVFTCLAVVILAILASVGISSSLKGAVEHITLAAELRDVPDRGPPSSVIAEVWQLQVAVATVVGNMTHLKSFVPQSLLKNSGDGDETMSNRSTEFASIISGSSTNPLTTAVQDNHEEQVRAMRLDPAKLVKDKHNDLTVVDGVVAAVAFGLPDVSDPSFQRILDSHMTITVALGTRHRGTIREIKPNRVVISFDAVRGSGDHADRAVQFGLTLEKAFSRLADQVPCVILVDRGSFMSGACGTESLRQEVLYSTTFEHTLTLIPLIRSRLGTPLVATERIASALHRVTTVPIECVSWRADGDQPLILHAVFGGISADRAESFSLMRSSFAHLRRGEYAEAGTQLQICVKGLEGSKFGNRLLPVTQRLQALSQTQVNTPYCRVYSGWGAVTGEKESEDADNVTIGSVTGQGVAGVIDEVTKAIYANEPQFQDTAKEEESSGLFALAVAAEEDNSISGPDVDLYASAVTAGGTVWAKGDQIGAGAFGRVFRARSATGSLAAIKMLPLQKSTIDVEQIQKEVSVAATMHHENLVTYVGTHVTTSTLSIVMELITGGSLRSHMREFGQFPDKVVRRFVMDLVRGIAFLHSKGTVHCDVKPENILVTADGVCKVADFGSSVTAVNSPLKEFDDLRVLGSPQYMAPEVARGDDPIPASDVWSIGIVVCELALGTAPWNSHQAVVKQGTRLVQVVGRLSDDAPPDTIQTAPLTNLKAKVLGDELRDFLQQCLVVDPARRSTCSMLLSSPFLL